MTLEMMLGLHKGDTRSNRTDHWPHAIFNFHANFHFFIFRENYFQKMKSECEHSYSRTVLWRVSSTLWLYSTYCSCVVHGCTAKHHLIIASHHISQLPCYCSKCSLTAGLCNPHYIVVCRQPHYGDQYLTASFVEWNTRNRSLWELCSGFQA